VIRIVPLRTHDGNFISAALRPLEIVRPIGGAGEAWEVLACDIGSRRVGQAEASRGSRLTVNLLDIFDPQAPSYLHYGPR
jgi:hypothetical protein